MLRLTQSGKDLLLRTIAGQAAINFAAIQLGNGADAGYGAAALSNPLLDIEISGYEVGDIFVTLTAIFSNNEVVAGFRATELGVLADDPDNIGETLLYAYEYTTEADADRIPASTDKVLETQMDVLVYIGDAENVTASISQSIAYASRTDFEAFVARRDNPHQVTAGQVGLGKVPNVATNDQTPTYTAASALTALESGEKLSAAFGKIAKAVGSLIAHIGTVGKNVHKETPASIGAAKLEHKHSATDITSGILGIARGGLGNDKGNAASATKLATARNILIDLASSAKAAFDGSADATPGVAGVLPPSNGGTGETSLDALAEKFGYARIAAGSYTGTGASGEDSPNTLTFDFQPKVVIIDTAGQNNYAAIPYVWGSDILTVVYSRTTTTSVFAHTYRNKVTLSGNTMSWFAFEFESGGDYPQLNAKNTVYRYVAIG